MYKIIKTVSLNQTNHTPMQDNLMLLKNPFGMLKGELGHHYQGKHLLPWKTTKTYMQRRNYDIQINLTKNETVVFQKEKGKENGLVSHTIYETRKRRRRSKVSSLTCSARTSNSKPSSFRAFAYSSRIPRLTTLFDKERPKNSKYNSVF